MAAPSGPPVFSNQELVNELEGLLPTHWDEQQLERKWDACVANPDGGLERFAFTAMELKYLARERLAEVHALRVENNLLRGENASLAARCDAMQKLVQEAVPEGVRAELVPRREVPRRRRRALRETPPRRAAAVPGRRPRFRPDEE